MKSHITVATLLAAQVSAHGYLEDRNARCYWFQNQFDLPMMLPFPNAAENRLGDEHFVGCKTASGQDGYKQGKGECRPVAEICPLASFWASDAVADPRDSHECAGNDIRLGCCAGYQETNMPMRSFEYEMSNGKKTACWAKKNTGIPTALDNTGVRTFNGHAALHVDNLVARETYVAGGEFELSWVATAQHGGSVEVGIVCDGDESYENFAKNRMEQLGGTMYSTQDGSDAGAPVIVSPDAEWAWSHSQYARFTHKMRMPLNARGKCTIGWFWWGLKSHGVFTQCMDVEVLAPGSEQPVNYQPTNSGDMVAVTPSTPVNNSPSNNSGSNNNRNNNSSSNNFGSSNDECHIGFFHAGHCKACPVGTKVNHCEDADVSNYNNRCVHAAEFEIIVLPECRQPRGSAIDEVLEILDPATGEVVEVDVQNALGASGSSDSNDGSTAAGSSTPNSTNNSGSTEDEIDYTTSNLDEDSNSGLPFWVIILLIILGLVVLALVLAMIHYCRNKKNSSGSINRNSSNESVEMQTYDGIFVKSAAVTHIRAPARRSLNIESESTGSSAQGTYVASV